MVSQSKARQAGKREEAETEAVSALPEQLDQCLRRLAIAEAGAAEKTRYAMLTPKTLYVNQYRPWCTDRSI